MTTVPLYTLHFHFEYMGQYPTTHLVSRECCFSEMLAECTTARHFETEADISSQVQQYLLPSTEGVMSVDLAA